jgi:hypothetical protein
MFAVPTKKDLKMKDRADLLEAFIGALYVDKDLVIMSSNLSKIKSLSLKICCRVNKAKNYCPLFLFFTIVKYKVINTN